MSRAVTKNKALGGRQPTLLITILSVLASFEEVRKNGFMHDKKVLKMKKLR